MPTFGFTSLSTMLSHGAIGNVPWKCIFPTDSGAFFVNYVITAGLIGCGMELIRLPEILWYTIIVCRSKSKAELPFIQSTTAKFEFQYGEHYARSMMLLCMIVTYSVACPLITPFGCMYFITKHYVDRHNIFYVYKPSKINKRVHATAISFVILSTVVLQFFMTIFRSVSHTHRAKHTPRERAAFSICRQIGTLLRGKGRIMDFIPFLIPYLSLLRSCYSNFHFNFKMNLYI